METIRKNLFVILAVVFAITAGVLVYVAVNASSPSVPVVVASKNLGVGTQLALNDLSIKNLPKSAVPSTSFKNPNNIIGKTITAGPIVNGDIIRGEHLSESSSLMSALRAFAFEGWVAAELPANSSLGLIGLKRGDKVDIYGEVAMGEGSIVDILVEGAIILTLPDDKAKNYVVAIPPEYAKVIAEKIVRSRPVVVVLPESTPESISEPISESMSEPELPEVEE